MTTSNYANLNAPSGRVVMLRDVEVPPQFFDRIKTNVQVLDEIYGGPDMPGILPGSVILKTGMPGAGKTTLCLQMAEMYAKAGYSVLYNIGEENEKMIRLTANRLGLPGNFPVSSFVDVEELCRYVAEGRVEVLFQDSLQSLQFKGLIGTRLLRGVGRRLIELAKDAEVAVVLVGQITKGGDFAGPMALKHDVDGHAHLSLNKDSGNRVIQMTKNRFGPANLPYEFTMGATGMDFKAVTLGGDGDPTSGGGRGAQRRDEARALVRELLLDGKGVNGYSHEGDVYEMSNGTPNLSNDPRLRTLGLSGNFMRGVLRMVVRQLQTEGRVLREDRLDGRSTWFLEA